MNLLLLNNGDFLKNSRHTARITGKRHNHLIKVLKVKPYDQLKIGQINGNIGKGTIRKITSEFVELETELTTPPPAPIPCILIIALPRPKSLRKVIECSISLGIKKIFIIGSYRVEKSYWSSQSLTKGKLDEFIINGLEQARDTVFPSIEIKKFFKPFVEDELTDIVKGTRAFLAHPYDANTCPVAINSPFTLVIGPEGGFIPYEVEHFKKQGFECISYGTRVLRIEYAIPGLVCRLY